VKIGKLSREELTEIEKAALPGTGSCSMMGRPTPWPASWRRWGCPPPAAPRCWRWIPPAGPGARGRPAGHRVPAAEPHAAAIVTRQAIENAMAVDMALGGSTNSVLHLLAIAHQAEIRWHWTSSIRWRGAFPTSAT